jgi:hypothetical protein
MRAIVILVGAVVAVVCCHSDVSAQSGSSSGSRSGSGAQAPVGHRQPTQSGVQGSEAGQIGMNPQLRRQEKELDRKLNSICRGC